MPYEVRTPVFEGPFDLLLHLILQQEVELFEVSLRAIVDEYLAEIERMETLDLDVATEFLLIAATLVELKARRLLPGLGDAELDEELLRFEERDLLLARLLECKTFKDAADAVRRAHRPADRSLPAIAGPRAVPARSCPTRSTGSRLRSSPPRRGARSAEAEADRRHRSRRAGAGERGRRRRASCSTACPSGAVSFARSRRRGERVEAVVRFLAVLELYKQGVVELDQLETFGTLTVTRLAETVSLDALSVADWDLDVTDGPRPRRRRRSCGRTPRRRRRPDATIDALDATDEPRAEETV
jgi:segregation and condensation protein A